LFTRDQIALDAHNRMLEIERTILTPIYAAIHLAGCSKELSIDPVSTEDYLKKFTEPRVQLGSMKLESGQLEEWLTVVDELTEVNNAMLMDSTLSTKYKRLIVAAKEGIHKKLIQNQGEFMERGKEVHEAYQKVLTELLMYLPFEFPVEIDPSIEEDRREAARQEEEKKAKEAKEAEKKEADKEKVDKLVADKHAAEKETENKGGETPAEEKKDEDAKVEVKEAEAEVAAVPVQDEKGVEEKKAVISPAEGGLTDNLEERIAKREEMDQSNVKKLIDHKR